MILTVTTMVAGVLGLIYLALTFRVIQLRFAGKVSLGDGGNPLLLARSRAHGNFSEYVPILLILTGLLEFAGGSPFWLGVGGLVFVGGRLLHAWGMDLSASNSGPNRPRIFGTVLTLSVLLAFSVWALILAAGALA